MARVEPLGAAIFGVPSAAVREDLFAPLLMSRYAGSMAKLLIEGPAPALSKPFSHVLDECGVTDPFIRSFSPLFTAAGAHILENVFVLFCPFSMAAWWFSAGI